MIISSFGVHLAGGVPFLVQASGATNLISPELKSPFQLHLRPRRMRCPHQIDLETYLPAPDWITDPLAAVCIPVPRQPGEKIKVLYDPDGHVEGLLRHLSRLSTPTQSLHRPIWWRTPPLVQREYLCTNISPVIWSSASINHCGYVDQHLGLAEAFNRRVLIVARDRLPLFNEVEWITTDLKEADISSYPLEAIGAGLLRQYMDDACT